MQEECLSSAHVDSLHFVVMQGSFYGAKGDGVSKIDKVFRPRGFCDCALINMLDSFGSNAYQISKKLVC